MLIYRRLDQPGYVPLAEAGPRLSASLPIPHGTVLRPEPKGAAPARAKRFLRCCLTDSLYDDRLLEKLYRQHYGTCPRMFDVQAWSGPKVAVTTVAEEPVILTNYQVDVPRPERCGRSMSSDAWGPFVTRAHIDIRIRRIGCDDGRASAADLAMVGPSTIRSAGRKKS